MRGQSYLKSSEATWILKNFNKSRSSTSAVTSPRPGKSRLPGSILLQADLGVGRHRGRHRRSEADHARLQQLPRAHAPSQGARGRVPRPRRYGSGCTGSRFLNGTLDLHEQLESSLAEFLGKEACLVFSTGYSANLGLISGLVGRGEVVYLDKLDHASIVDGAKLSYGETERFNHGDLANLERRLERNGGTRGSMIVVDGVYSMEGNIADVPNLVRIARRYGSALALDDAHALGVLGPNGDGTAAHFGLIDEVDIIAGTFSKSLASIGGFVAGSESVIHYLKHNCRPLIFTASLPPANTAGVLAALAVLQREPERREMLWANTRRLHAGFRSLGFDIGPTQTPIVPVLIGPLGRTTSCDGGSSTPGSSPIRSRRRRCRRPGAGSVPASWPRTRSSK